VKYVTPAGNSMALTVPDTMVSPKLILEPGIAAPTFRMTALKGPVINLEDYKDKVILLDFWASWCKPWENDLLYLKHIYYRYHHQGFEIIGLNLDYDLDRLKKYINTHRIPWPQITDGRGWDMPLVELYRVEAMPKNFLLDRNSIIRYKNLRRKNLENKVRELLNESNVGNTGL